MSLKNPVTPPRIDPGTVRLVVQRLNHYATPDPLSRNVQEQQTQVCVPAGARQAARSERGFSRSPFYSNAVGRKSAGSESMILIIFQRHLQY